jgi:hypothetical protein
MKASTVIVSALATLVAAAPTEKKVEERGFNDFLGGGFSGFPSTNVNYLFGLNNGLNNFNVLQQLALNQNFGFNQFDGLFNANNQFLDLNTILQLQQLSDLAAIAQLGVFGGFDLAQLNLQNALLQTGLLNLGGANLGQFVQPNVVTQVQTIASQVFVVKE